MSLILSSYSDHVGTITFNHAETRNSLSNELLGGLIEALQLFAEHKARAVIIRALPGVKVWSSGFDITELPVPGRDPLSYNDPLEQALREIQLFPAPVIAMNRGERLGRGLRPGLYLRPGHRVPRLLVRHHPGQDRGTL